MGIWEQAVPLPPPIDIIIDTPAFQSVSLLILPMGCMVQHICTCHHIWGSKVRRDMIWAIISLSPDKQPQQATGRSKYARDGQARAGEGGTCSLRSDCLPNPAIVAADLFAPFLLLFLLPLLFISYPPRHMSTYIRATYQYQLLVCYLSVQNSTKYKTQSLSQSQNSHQCGVFVELVMAAGMCLRRTYTV